MARLSRCSSGGVVKPKDVVLVFRAVVLQGVRMGSFRDHLLQGDFFFEHVRKLQLRRGFRTPFHEIVRRLRSKALSQLCARPIGQRSIAGEEVISSALYWTEYANELKGLFQSAGNRGAHHGVAAR